MNNRTKGKRVVIIAGTFLVVLVLGTVWLSWDNIRSWYSFWRQFERLPDNEQGYPEYRHRETGIVFVRVPGGVPSPNSDNIADANVEPFLMAKQEVTQKEWEKVTGNNPGKPKADDQPVNSVSWYDCQGFCEKTGLSIPTIAQWDFVVVKRYGIIDMEPSGTGGTQMEWCRHSPDPGFVESIDFSLWRHAMPFCTKLSSEHRPVRGRKAFYPQLVCQANDESGLNGIYPNLYSSIFGFRPAYCPLP